LRKPDEVAGSRVKVEARVERPESRAEASGEWLDKNSKWGMRNGKKTRRGQNHGWQNAEVAGGESGEESRVEGPESRAAENACLNYLFL